MSADVIEHLDLPDRFEALRESAQDALGSVDALGSIIFPVDHGLAGIDEHFLAMRAARRGALLILLGRSGVGKSTFLDTVKFFRPEVITVHVPPEEDVVATMRTVPASVAPRLLVLDGREAARDVTSEAMHAINSFVRSERGRDTLVVWPTNSPEVTVAVVDLARTIGAEALFGAGEPFTEFTGPPRSEYLSIATKTLALLNEGKSLISLGISHERAEELANEASSIGHYIQLISREATRNGRHARGLIKNEPYSLWILVASGDDDLAEGDVDSLTRHQFRQADIERLLTATDANVVVDLKQAPEKVGLIANILDVRIIFMDMLTSATVMQGYGSEALHEILRGYNVTIPKPRKAPDRVTSSELGKMLSGSSLGSRRRGRRPGTDVKEYFLRLPTIARTNDGLLNAALGEALKDAGLVTGYLTESELGTGHKLFTDLFCARPAGNIRLEVMWRGDDLRRGELAKYILEKIRLYGKAESIL